MAKDCLRLSQSCNSQSDSAMQSGRKGPSAPSSKWPPMARTNSVDAGMLPGAKAIFSAAHGYRNPGEGKGRGKGQNDGPMAVCKLEHTGASGLDPGVLFPCYAEPKGGTDRSIRRRPHRGGAFREGDGTARHQQGPLGSVMRRASLGGSGPDAFGDGASESSPRCRIRAPGTFPRICW